MTLATLRAPQPHPHVYRCGTLRYTTRGLVALFAWMFWGDFCFTLMEAVVPSIMPLKLHSLNSPDTLISMIMTSLPGVFNLAITPTISFWSDRVRTRWGRRLPFILTTMPFLAVSLVLIGYVDSIGAWAHAHFLAGAFSQAKATILLLAVFAALFDLFNMFVNTVYWYLFNDVVPPEMLGRFLSWFKLVSTLTSMLYNLLIFQYAESHMRWIYLGAAGLYLFGFGIVCLRVKEGQYPALHEDAQRPSVLADITTAVRECFSQRFYWDIFLEPTFACLGGCISVFGLFFNQSMGLDLQKIGWMNGLGMWSAPVCFLFVGFLVDRWQPVRVSAYLNAYTAFFCLGGWVWLCIDKPDPLVYLWLSVIIGSVFSILARTAGDVAGGVRFMRLLPKEKFGQFSGAMCLVRAAAIISGGLIAGAYLDLCRCLVPRFGQYFYRYAEADPEFQRLFVYRLMFLFSGTMTIIAFCFHYRVYRAWKRLGGEKAYLPPAGNLDLRSLPPQPDDSGHVHWTLLLLVGLSFAGNLLGGLVWILYYTRYHPDSHNARVFAIATGLNIVLFPAYLRFIKFMERP